MNDKLEGVHGLRGLAALLIVLFHLKAVPGIPLPPPFAGLVGQLYLSVMLFFVISAFALTHTSRRSPATLAAYAIKRFFRIAPLFYAVLAFILWRGGLPDWHVLLANLTFTFNLVPGFEESLVWAGWSVGVEMVFYALLPALLALCRDWRRAAAACAGALALSLWLWSVLLGHPGLPANYVYFFVGSNLVSFVAGIAAYRLFERLRGGGGARARALVPWVALALLVAASGDVLGLASRLPGAFVAAHGLAFAAACLWQAVRPSAALRLRALQWLGDRSYSIYLLHPIVIVLLMPRYEGLWAALGVTGGAAYLAAAAVTLPAVFAAAEVTYRLVETPGIALGARLAARFPAPAAPPVPASAAGARGHGRG